MRRKHRKRWTPFQRASVDTGRITDPEYAALAAQLHTDCELFLNSRYQVTRRKSHVYQDDTKEIVGEVIHLSIHNLERTADHDWRDLQRIKNELIGEEEEAFELFPAESRLVDSSNEFHIWCMKGIRLPVGFGERLVGYSEHGSGAVQRPWEEGSEPADAKMLTNEDAVKWMREEVLKTKKEQS